MKIIEKPITKKRLLIKRYSLSEIFMDLFLYIALLDIMPIYTGTRGSTHGDIKASKPAIKEESKPISNICLPYFYIILI